MQIEVYNMEADESNLTITLEAVCDSFSSLLWDIEYYQCGSFEVYIAANPQNIEIFQTGRIVGRDDDNQHFGIIESVLINTDIENGDYLTVRGRFLMCLLERRMGFFCEADGDDTIRMDTGELKSACWCRPDEIELQPQQHSLTNEMMKLFRDTNGQLPPEFDPAGTH